MKNPIINRIYAKIICDIKTHCWNWIGYLNKDGYGRMCISNKQYMVHRVIYEKLCGPIPKDKPCVLHTCDNPKCCNPIHLYVGTHQDNMDDMIKRNRSSIGIKRYCAKLTEKDVLEIRQSKETLVILAKRFNVSFGNISHIKNHKKWKHI